MTSIDKYSLISLAPSLAVIVGVVAITVFGIVFLKKAIAKDAAKAGE
ncbi:MAG: hypothetical protein ACK4L8_07970 [Nitrincola lacisaponensis]|uniref:DUF3149 domain-containing protein n=1 Tax=Nitrincola lacisaponensis TaxID=267850 RepID=A0A063Y164_9GAMM|nr:hypothetical protein [Nitrincola lacisaponensis]KDE40048.1 hypothetical protein ADINL_1685 [Nitrincola lacisaponensis]